MKRQPIDKKIIEQLIIEGELLNDSIQYEDYFPSDVLLGQWPTLTAWATRVIVYVASILEPDNQYIVQLKRSLTRHQLTASDLLSAIALLKVLSTDIDRGLFKHLEESTVVPITKANLSTLTNDVFIVHGHDNLAKISVARFLERLKLNPIILHEQTNAGRTIIEKIEAYTNVGFAVVLYTECDLGGKDIKSIKPRARQNVVFEHGYLMGKIGRSNVCALVKGNVETPSDISGVVYTPMDTHDGWHYKLAKELKASGYQIDLNDI